MSDNAWTNEFSAFIYAKISKVNSTKVYFSYFVALFISNEKCNSLVLYKMYLKKLF